MSIIFSQHTTEKTLFAGVQTESAQGAQRMGTRGFIASVRRDASKLASESAILKSG